MINAYIIAYMIKIDSIDDDELNNSMELRLFNGYAIYIRVSFGHDILSGLFADKRSGNPVIFQGESLLDGSRGKFDP